MSSKNETYNGWTNYATWRVQLEIFDGMEIDEAVTHESVREYAEQVIEDTSTPGLARDYALAFLSDVDWQEIAENLNDYNEINIRDEEDEDPDPYAGSELAGGQEGNPFVFAYLFQRCRKPGQQ